MTAIDLALGRTQAPIPRVAWVLGLLAAAALSIGTLFLPSVQQQLAWGALAALAFAAIPLLWREGYTWVILWAAPIVGFEPVPTITIRVAKYGLVVLAIGIAISKRRFGNSRFSDFDQSPIWAAMLLISWLAIRTFTGRAPLVGGGEVLRLSAVCFLVYMWLTESPANGGRQRWFSIWLIMALFEVAASFVEATTFGRLRSYGTFVNANSLGGYFMLTTSLVATVAMLAPNRGTRIVAGLALPAIFLGLYLSGSRSSWLCTVIVLIVVSILARAWRVAAAGLCIAALLMSLYVYHPIFSYATNAALRLETGMTHRDLLWEAADKAIAKAPLLGYGLGSVGQEVERFAKYPSDIHRVLTADVMQSGNPHNFYREMILSSGLIGLFLMLYLVFLVLRRAFRRLRSRDPWRCVYALALIGATCGVLVQSYFEHSMFLGSMSVAVFYWFLVAQTLRADDPEFAEGRLT